MTAAFFRRAVAEYRLAPALVLAFLLGGCAAPSAPEREDGPPVPPPSNIAWEQSATVIGQNVPWGVQVRADFKAQRIDDALRIVITNMTLFATSRETEICRIDASISEPIEKGGWTTAYELGVLPVDIKLQKGQLWKFDKQWTLDAKLGERERYPLSGRVTLLVQGAKNGKCGTGYWPAHSYNNVLYTEIEAISRVVWARKIEKERSAAEAEAARLEAARIAASLPENRAKRFIEENLSACTTVGWRILEVSIRSEFLTFRVETERRSFSEVRVDLRGAQAEIYNATKVQFRCGSGNCVQWSFSRAPDSIQYFECGAAGTAESLVRAFGAYITKLPAAATF